MTGTYDSKSVKWLGEHGDDPKVTEALVRWIERHADDSRPDREVVAAAAQAFVRRRPAPTDSFIAAATLLYVKSSEIQAQIPGWFEQWDDPRVTAALQARLARISAQRLALGSADSLRLVTELERRKVAATPAHLDGILRIYGTYSLPEYAAILRSKGDEAVSGLLARVSASSDKALRSAGQLLACELGRCKPEDVPAVLAAFDAHVAAEQRRAYIAGASEDSAKAGVPDYFTGKEGPLKAWRTLSEKLAPYGAERRALVALGKAAVPPLRERFNSEKPLQWTFAASVLIESDLVWLANEVEESISALLAAEIRHAPTKELALRAAKGLVALASAPARSVADRCYLVAFASSDWRVTYLALEGLKERLPPEALALAVLLFVSDKTTFNQLEVDRYRAALVKLGDNASAILVKSLESLLGTAKGNPAGVRWVQKVIAIEALNVVGDEGAYDILRRFEKDSGSFKRHQSVRDEATGKVLREGTATVSFRQLCRDAISAIEKRTGKRAPGG